MALLERVEKDSFCFRDSRRHDRGATIEDYWQNEERVRRRRGRWSHGEYGISGIERGKQAWEILKCTQSSHKI